MILDFAIGWLIYFTDPDWWDGLDGSELNIDLIGVEKEVEMLPIFAVSVKLSCQQDYWNKSSTAQSLYNTPQYNTDLDMTWLCCDSEIYLTMEFYVGHPIKNETFSIVQWIYMLDLWNLVQS